MRYRKFMSLTDDEIRQIVTDIFSPKKITCIKREKRLDIITCKIYTAWEGDPESGDPDEIITADVLTMRNPFTTAYCLSVDFSICQEDISAFKKYCLAKGICPYLEDNKYLTDTDAIPRREVMDIVDDVSKEYDSGNLTNWYAETRRRIEQVETA